MGKIKARKFMKDSLHEQWRNGVGTPKTGKDRHNATDGTIHSNVTFRTYRGQCDLYADWLQERGLTSPEAARDHVEEYLTDLIDQVKSSYTIHTAACAIAKAFRCRTTDFNVQLPKRTRSGITRSRLPAERDRHFSPENNRDLIVFCSCFGPRRHELEAMRGTDCIFTAGGIRSTVIGKGGKERTITAHFDSAEEFKICRRLILQAGTGKIFPKVHDACDCHYYRSIFAARVYRAAAPAEIPAEDRYHCRGDKKGQVYSRNALLKTSRQLGHNRLDVVVNNYSHNFR